MGQVWMSFVLIFSCLGFARTESSTVGGFCAFPCSLQNRTYINAVLDSGFTYTVSSDDPTIQLVSNTITNSTEIWECFQRVGPFYALRRKINETHSYYRCLKDTMYDEPHDIVIFYFTAGTMVLPNYPTICDVCNGRHLSIIIMKDCNVETFLSPCEQASNFSEEKEYSYADEKSYDKTSVEEMTRTYYVLRDKDISNDKSNKDTPSKGKTSRGISSENKSLSDKSIINTSSEVKSIENVSQNKATTEGPTTTTEAPKMTNVAPKTTVAAIQTTTEATQTTTEAPKTTAEAPKTTTAATQATTEAPKTTTSAPKTTTEASKTMAEAPKTTTGAIQTKTEAPKTATVAPKTTTEVPKTTTEAHITEEDDTKNLNGKSTQNVTPIDNSAKNKSRKKRDVNDNSLKDASSMDTSNKIDFSRNNSVKDKDDIPGTYYILNDKDRSTDDHNDIVESYYVPKDESQNAISSFDTSSDRSFSHKGKLCCLEKSTYSSLSLYYTDSNSYKSRKHSKGCKRVKVPPLVCNMPSICPVVYYGQIPCSGCEPSEGPGLCCNCV